MPEAPGEGLKPPYKSIMGDVIFEGNFELATGACHRTLLVQFEVTEVIYIGAVYLSHDFSQFHGLHREIADLERRRTETHLPFVCTYRPAPLAAAALRVARDRPFRACGEQARRSGLKWMCPRRQRFTRSGPADLGEADRDGRSCVAANGECAGRSLRAGRRAVLVGATSCRRALARAR